MGCVQVGVGGCGMWMGVVGACVGECGMYVGVERITYS